MNALTEICYALPLIVSISIVYAGTRYEDMRVIIGNAARVGGWITGLMGLIWIVLLLVSWWL